MEGKEKWELLVKLDNFWKKEGHCFLPTGASAEDAKKKLAG